MSHPLMWLHLIIQCSQMHSVSDRGRTRVNMSYVTQPARKITLLVKELPKLEQNPRDP